VYKKFKNLLHRRHVISSMKNKNKNFHSYILEKWNIQIDEFEVSLHGHWLCFKSLTLKDPKETFKL